MFLIIYKYKEREREKKELKKHIKSYNNQSNYKKNQNYEIQDRDMKMFF